MTVAADTSTEAENALTRRGLVARVPVFRRSLDQVTSYAAAWADHNALSLELAATDQERPLWVALGDSTAQGVGATAHDRGYVGRVHSLLPPTWLLVNLSRSGARTREVVDAQWPRAEAMLAGRVDSLVTAVIGGNDLRRTPLAQHLRDAHDLVAALPAEAVVSTMPRGLKEKRALQVNRQLQREAAASGLRVADLWAHTGAPYRGLYADGFHPNDRGYHQWTDAVAAALGLTGNGA